MRYGFGVNIAMKTLFSRMALPWTAQEDGWWICDGFGVEMVMETVVFVVFAMEITRGVGGGFAMASVRKGQ